MSWAKYKALGRAAKPWWVWTVSSVNMPHCGLRQGSGKVCGCVITLTPEYQQEEKAQDWSFRRRERVVKAVSRAQLPFVAEMCLYSSVLNNVGTREVRRGKRFDSSLTRGHTAGKNINQVRLQATEHLMSQKSDFSGASVRDFSSCCQLKLKSVQQEITLFRHRHKSPMILLLPPVS